MSFRLITVLWLFALLASAMGTFGSGWGVIWSGAVLFFWGVLDRGGLAACGLIAAAVLLVVLLLPAVQSAREAASEGARRGHCLNNLKQLTLALHMYHDKHGSFPPAYTADEAGRPLHSWRVLVLPYIEELNLYSAINLDEPWDSPANQKFADSMPPVYQCPSCRAYSQQRDRRWNLPGVGCTNYFAIVGEETLLRAEESLTFNEVADGTSNTLVLLEAADRAVNWMQPVDLTQQEAVGLLTSPRALRHVFKEESLFVTRYYWSGGNAGFADGRVRYLGAMTPESAAGLLTVSGGETWDEDFEVHWPPEDTLEIIRWGHIFSFALFVALSLAPALRKNAKPEPRA